jgi:hypothetical protein
MVNEIPSSMSAAGGQKGSPGLKSAWWPVVYANVFIVG